MSDRDLGSDSDQGRALDPADRDLLAPLEHGEDPQAGHGRRAHEDDPQKITQWNFSSMPACSPKRNSTMLVVEDEGVRASLEEHVPRLPRDRRRTDRVRAELDEGGQHVGPETPRHEDGVSRDQPFGLARADAERVVDVVDEISSRMVLLVAEEVLSHRCLPPVPRDPHHAHGREVVAYGNLEADERGGALETPGSGRASRRPSARARPRKRRSRSPRRSASAPPRAPGGRRPGRRGR